MKTVATKREILMEIMIYHDDDASNVSNAQFCCNQPGALADLFVRASKLIVDGKGQQK